ncbi:MAG: hypothetical protein AAGG81_02540 [Chlamydiota bacterium]
MSITNIQNPHDAISFIYNRPEKSELNLPSEGISSLQNTLQLLEEGKYIPILEKIWAEQDHSILLQWLRSLPQIHAPLLAERAIAEFNETPTVETIIKVSIPLIKAAGYRTMQDCRGVYDASLMGSHEDLCDVYLQELDKLFTKSLNYPLATIIPENQAKIEKYAKERTIEILQLSLTEKLPCSSWVAQHGMNAFTGKIILFNPADSDRFKKDFVDEITKSFEVS